MFRFKNLYSADSQFSFNGSTYNCANFIFQTEDKDLADFLRQNVNFVEEKTSEDSSEKKSLKRKKEVEKEIE